LASTCQAGVAFERSTEALEVGWRLETRADLGVIGAAEHRHEGLGVSQEDALHAVALVEVADHVQSAPRTSRLAPSSNP